MTATVADGVMRVDWVLGSQDITTPFWIGTFDAPSDAEEPYTWTSQRDVAATESALLASSEDAKDFTFSNSVISYTVTIQDESATVELRRK